MSDAALAVESSGRFAIGRWRVHRACYGAMQLAGEGPPTLGMTVRKVAETIRLTVRGALPRSWRVSEGRNRLRDRIGTPPASGRT
jgi:hypothetical protein